MIKLKFWSAVLALGIVMAAGPVAADEVKLPKGISWVTYGTSASSYAQSVGIGQALKKNYGVDVRIIPAKNDVARMVPIRSGDTDLCVCGMGAYFAQEGVHQFADKAWGPMPLFNLFNNVGRIGVMIVAAGDAGIKSIADVKGKRVTWVKGSPTHNTNMTAWLAFGGLTWDDVEKVEVPGWRQSAEAVIDGRADVTSGTTVSSAYNKLAASPRGLFWVALPHADKAAWDRYQKVAPYLQPRVVENAISGELNSTGKMPFDGAAYPFPAVLSGDRLTEEVAYSFTKAVMENYEDLKDAGPAMDGFQLSKQQFDWVYPYHAGAIKYYKEKGVWSAADDAHNAALLKRQAVLAKAWNAYKSSAAEGDGFQAGWLEARAAALKDAGMEVVFGGN